MRPALLAAALLLTSTLPAAAQSIEGVWRPAEIAITGAHPARHVEDVQPGLIIFTRTHYSGMWVNGYTPRPDVNASSTDADRARVWGAFTANAGTYVLKDSTLSYTPTVAKNPSVMVGKAYTINVRLRGDTAWFTAASGDTMQTTAKWIRVERMR